MPFTLQRVQRAYRSPLRYPGGKQRAAKAIADILDARIPAGSSIASPFFGGGSVELELASRGHRVTASDFFAPVAAFWNQLKADPERLHTKCKEWCELPLIDKGAFYQMQSNIRQLLASVDSPAQTHAFELAWQFFVINRKSFSGATLSGGMATGDRFNRNAVDRLLDVDLSNITVKHGDYWDQLFDRARRRFTFDAIYADPPYCLETSKLYGDRGSTHEEFDHERFARHMQSLASKHNVPILVSYNDCDTVRQLFDGWNFRPISWAYGMNSSKQSNEILISNF